MQSKRPNGWWQDKEHCKEAALSSNTHQEFRKNYPVAVRVSKKKGWYDEITQHMPAIITLCTFDECQKEALKFNTRRDFRKISPRQYGKATKEGWLDMICCHMTEKIKHKAGYWESLEHCIETALQYDSRPELRKHEKGCHDAILKYGWQDICFAHMNCRVSRYSDEQLREIALKYSSHKEFRENNLGAYAGAKARGILESITQHMPPLKVRRKFTTPLTYENCKAAALKYSKRSDFMTDKNDRRFYGYAKKNGWLDNICSHMRRVGNLKKRCVYVAVFDDDHSIYVGITCDVERRWQDHVSKENSSVHLHIQECGQKPRFEKLTDYIDESEAARMEDEYVHKYTAEGWNVLNRVKAGALGAMTPGYSKEEVLEHARQYHSLKDFRENDAGHYEAGYRSDYWEEVRAVCKPLLRIFTDEQLAEIAAGCKTIAGLRKKDHVALNAAKNRGILDEICAHMDRSHEKHKYSDEEKWEAVRQCKTMSEFCKKFHALYASMHHAKEKEKYLSGLIDDRRVQKWTEEAIAKEALKYKHRSDFMRGAKTAYANATKMKILDKVCAHMTPKIKSKYKCDSIDDAKALAAQCNGRHELRKKFKVAYDMLKEAKLLDEVIPKIHNSWNLKWTYEERKKVAAICSSRTEFKRRFPQAFEICRINNEFDDYCQHFTFKRHKWEWEELVEPVSHCHNMKELKEYNYEVWYHIWKKGKTKLLLPYFKK